MITSVVAAIAISQREARRKKAEQQAELEAASKKSVVVVSAGTSGLATAYLLSQFGFSVTIVDERDAVDVLGHEDALTVVPAMTVELLVKGGKLEPEEEFAEALKEIGEAETLTYRRYKSSKPLLTTPLSSTSALVVPTEDLHSLLSDYTKARLYTKTKIISYHDAPEDLDGPLPHGRPYALAENGKKFYADIIIVCHDGGIARKHVCESAGCDDPQPKPTEWSCYQGVVDLEEYPGVRDGVNTWVGDESYLTGYKDAEEWFFTLHHLSDITDIPSHLRKWAPEVREAVQKATDITQRPLTARAPPASTVSRKSRKILLMGEEAMTLPPLSPHLPFAMHVESVATLAVCMRKAASVPLALEVYTRLRASRIEDAFKIGMTRLKTVTEAAEDEELEASEVKWDTEDPWWTFQADKVADAKFELVIEILTQELLGKQKAMLEAEAKRKEEEDKARAAAGGAEEVEEGETEGETEQRETEVPNQKQESGEKAEEAQQNKTTKVQQAGPANMPDDPVATKKTEKLKGSEVVVQEGGNHDIEQARTEESESSATPTVAEQVHPAKRGVASNRTQKANNSNEEANIAETAKPLQPSVVDENEESVEEQEASEDDGIKTTNNTESPLNKAECVLKKQDGSRPSPRSSISRASPRKSTGSHGKPHVPQEPTPPPSQGQTASERSSPALTDNTGANLPSPATTPEAKEHPQPLSPTPTHTAAGKRAEKKKQKPAPERKERNEEMRGTQPHPLQSPATEDSTPGTDPSATDDEDQPPTPTRSTHKTRPETPCTFSPPAIPRPSSPPTPRASTASVPSVKETRKPPRNSDTQATGGHPQSPRDSGCEGGSEWSESDATGSERRDGREESADGEESEESEEEEIDAQ